MSGGGEVIRLLVNESATSAGKQVIGGHYLWVESGTQGGASITLQFFDPTSQAWVAVTGSISTDDAATTLHIPEGIYRAFVDGGTPTNLYACLHRIPDD